MNKSKQNNLNQFSNYKSQLKTISNIYSIAQDFDYILNNIFCTYSVHILLIKVNLNGEKFNHKFLNHIDLEYL